MDLKHRISNLMVGSVQSQLDVLSLLLKDVYLPLEGKNAETRKNLEKFISHISHTSVQVSGTVSIELPIVAIGDDIERDIADQELMANYAAAMESWTGTIVETIKRENEQRKRTSQTALAEIELWRSRSASYSNLIQQLSHRSVQVIQSRLEAYCKTENGLGNSVAEEFAKQMKLLGKLTSEAKENVKFLTTLERQFKNLAS